MAEYVEYKVEWDPVADKEIEDIVWYISDVALAPAAAKKLAENKCLQIKNLNFYPQKF
jgi:hypothetical protein